MRNRFLRTRPFLVLALIVLGSFWAEGQTYTYSTLYNFKDNGKDPANPYSYLSVDAAGNLYGTSYNGGSFGLGSVFKLTRTGSLTVLHSFSGGATDGSHPIANVVRDSAGNLYGTTELGGPYSYRGNGTLFKVTSSGQETILYNFTGGADGDLPGDVLLDSARNVYGTAAGNNGDLAGLLFKFSNAGVFQVLYTFCSLPNCADGEFPMGSIVRDSAGNIYGVTSEGGVSPGWGTVFSIAPPGIETVLYSFHYPDDGSDPVGGVIQDNRGNLYGTTSFGGTGGFGTLFKVPKNGGELTTLYNFCSLPSCADGAEPYGRIQMDKAGNLYGVTYEGLGMLGGGNGVIWKVDPSGNQTVLYTFGRKVVAFGGLTIDSAGNLYGTTVNGGRAHRGSVFKLTLVK